MSRLQRVIASTLLRQGLVSKCIISCHFLRSSFTSSKEMDGSLHHTDFVMKLQERSVTLLKWSQKCSAICHDTQQQSTGFSILPQHSASQEAQEARKAYSFHTGFWFTWEKRIVWTSDQKSQTNTPREAHFYHSSVTAMDKAQLCTPLGLSQPLLVPVELRKGLNTLCSLQEQDNSYLNAYDNKHPPATEANAIKRISFWHKKNQGNDMMYWQDLNYMRPKRQLKRVRPLLIG